MAYAGALAVWALAQPAIAEVHPPCGNDSGFALPETGVGLARVTGAPRTYFRNESSSCPNDSDACRSQAYVVPGDTVLTGMTRGEFVCVQYLGERSHRIGYVRQNEIAPQQIDRSPPLSAWAGAWHSGGGAEGGDVIELRPQGTALAISGNATWDSGNPGGVNLGVVEGTVTPQGNAATFTDPDVGDCRMEMTLASSFLVVSDNGKCGGLNVTFSGIYRRR